MPTAIPASSIAQHAGLTSAAPAAVLLQALDLLPIDQGCRVILRVMPRLRAPTRLQVVVYPQLVAPGQLLHQRKRLFLQQYTRDSIICGSCDSASYIGTLTRERVCFQMHGGAGRSRWNVVGC